VLLFGGEDAQGRRNDLWRFDLDAGKWAQVTTGNEPGAPPAMAGGVLVTSPVDGTISVLAGVTNQGAAQPAWQRTAQGWQAYSRVLSTIRVAPACLWPSNHKMVRYELGKEIRLRLPDDVGSQAIVRIKQVVSSEPEAGPGSGKLPDAVWGDQALCVRSERDGNGPGRTYSVEIEVMDLSGLVTYTAEIVVPHSVSDVAGCAEVKPVFVEDDGPCCTFPPSP